MLINNNEYFAVLEDIKTRIKTAQYKAVLGAKFIENLSRDILMEFPEIQGFSIRNLKYMRKFAEVYPDFQKVQRGVALLPWRNNLTLMSKVKDE